MKALNFFLNIRSTPPPPPPTGQRLFNRVESGTGAGGNCVQFR